MMLNSTVLVELVALTCSIPVALLTDNDALSLDPWGEVRLILIVGIYVLFGEG